MHSTASAVSQLNPQQQQQVAQSSQQAQQQQLKSQQNEQINTYNKFKGDLFFWSKFQFFFMFFFYYYLDSNSSIQIDQRRYEMLESRFVPLNQQKSVSQDVSNQSVASDDQNRLSDIQFIIVSC